MSVDFGGFWIVDLISASKGIAARILRMLELMTAVQSSCNRRESKDDTNVEGTLTEYDSLSMG